MLWENWRHTLHKLSLPWFHFLYMWQVCKRQPVNKKTTSVCWIPPTLRVRFSLWSSQRQQTHVMEIQSRSREFKLQITNSSKWLQLSLPWHSFALYLIFKCKFEFCTLNCLRLFTTLSEPDLLDGLSQSFQTRALGLKAHLSALIWQ